MRQTGQFTKVCQSRNVNYLEDRKNEIPENTNEMTENDPIDFAEFTSTNGWEKFQQDYFSVMAISEAVEVKSQLNCLKTILTGTPLNRKLTRRQCSPSQIWKAQCQF